ncbi:MAG: hypothetical protein KKI09_14995, partial [Spirochaetes bacterium]|nr:hypothetical protein [Spirochaetota bacterium]MBU0956732.1 hypothetical protein [Spirochaetota bacterium]
MVEELNSSIRTAAGTVQVAFDTISIIAGKIESWNQLKRQTASVIRLLYIEICKDLDLLAVLIDSKDAEIQWNDRRIVFFIKNFETSIMELVLLGNEKEEVYKKLSAKGRIQNLNDVLGHNEKKMQKYENVLQAIRFVYVKIDLLRKLILEDGDNELLRRVKVIERLRNIESRLYLAKRILGA